MEGIFGNNRMLILICCYTELYQTQLVTQQSIQEGGATRRDEKRMPVGHEPITGGIPRTWNEQMASGGQQNLGWTIFQIW